MPNFVGEEIVKWALSKKGQKYVLGAKVHLANPNWSGPWDCAEFVSWACYHAYKIVMAVQPADVTKGESYSGWWYTEGKERNALIPVAQAVATVGAVLVRRPGDFGLKVGHVAISRGDGTTIEAHSSKVGVAVRMNAGARNWTSGLLIPGVKYKTGQAVKVGAVKALLYLTSPYMRGAKVEALQKALKNAGVDPGPIDGVYGPATAAAVAAYQALAGLVVDGEVGAETRAALKP